MAIDTTKKIKQVTYNGTEIPLSGYDTSDATVTAGDIAKGVVAYGKNGKVTGSVKTTKKGNSSMWQGSTVSFKLGEYIDLKRENIWDDQLFRKGAFITLRAYASEFGNATAADVAKGKTFTSAAGLNVVGTAGGPEPVVIALPTYGLDNLKSYTLTHNLGRKPVAIYCMKGTRSSDSKSIQWFNAVLDPKTTYLLLYYVTSSAFGNRGQANVSEFPSSGFVGQPYYIQVGNANETTIDFKFGETSSFVADLSGAVFIVY